MLPRTTNGGAEEAGAGAGTCVDNRLLALSSAAAFVGPAVTVRAMRAILALMPRDSAEDTLLVLEAAFVGLMREPGGTSIAAAVASPVTREAQRLLLTIAQNGMRLPDAEREALLRQRDTTKGALIPL